MGTGFFVSFSSSFASDSAVAGLLEETDVVGAGSGDGGLREYDDEDCRDDELRSVSPGSWWLLLLLLLGLL